MKDKPVFIFFPHLGNMKFWKIIVESDAGHANANMEDAGGQLIMLVGEGGQLIMLVGEGDKWQSNKI